MHIARRTDTLRLYSTHLTTPAVQYFLITHARASTRVVKFENLVHRDSLWPKGKHGMLHDVALPRSNVLWFHTLRGAYFRLHAFYVAGTHGDILPFRVISVYVFTSLTFTLGASAYFRKDAAWGSPHGSLTIPVLRRRSSCSSADRRL